MLSNHKYEGPDAQEEKNHKHLETITNKGKGSQAVEKKEKGLKERKKGEQASLGVKSRSNYLLPTDHGSC